MFGTIFIKSNMRVQLLGNEENFIIPQKSRGRGSMNPACQFKSLNYVKSASIKKNIHTFSVCHSSTRPNDLLLL